MIDNSIIDRVIDHARQVAEGTLPDGGMSSALIFWRGENPYMIVWPQSETTEQTMHVARSVKYATSPDFICFVSDTYTTTQSTKRDGSRWEYGEMAYAREHNTVDADLVKDALMVHFADQSGHCTAQMTPYEIVDGKVVWDHEGGFDSRDHPDAKPEGFVVMAMKQMMAEKTLLDDTLSGDIPIGPEGAAEAREYAENKPGEALAGATIALMTTLLMPMGCTMGFFVSSDSPPGYAETLLRRLRELSESAGKVGQFREISSELLKMAESVQAQIDALPVTDEEDRR